MASTQTPPKVSFVIDQRFLIEPLGGSQGVRTYLDGFPDEVYDKSIDSHLVKFVYTLLGPVGVGEIRRNYLEARLAFEDQGLELTNLDQFYGNPFQFGRIEEETHTEDSLGLLPQEDWEKIRAKDARYRNRIIDFFAGARAGNTPLGMRLVARSGLGHEVEVIENYKYLYDSNSDDPLGINFFGKTRFLNEMIILPRQEVGVSEVQKINFLGEITGGSFRILIDNKYTESIPFDSTRQAVQTILENSPSIKPGDIEVTGGPIPKPLNIRFSGQLADRDVAQISATNELLGTNPQISTTTVIQGFDAASEVVDLSPRNQRHLQEALDRIRPVAVVPTVAAASGTKSSISWIRASASSEFDEIIRYVTGSGSVQWPPKDRVHWIEGGIEHQAPRPYGELPYNYQAFHKVLNVDSYDESHLLEPTYETETWHTLKERYVSNHIGGYELHHAAVFPFLRNIPNDEIQTADKVLADYAEPLTIDRVIDIPGASVGLILGIYPSDYQDLLGVPEIRYTNEQFWSSRERNTGTEYLELDLGQAKGVNYLTFDVSRKPIIITVEYDLLDQGGARRWVRATEDKRLPFSPLEQNPWQEIELYLSNSKNEMIYTRYLRISFERISNTDFLTEENTKYPWSIDARNLRVGRNIVNDSR